MNNRPRKTRPVLSLLGLAVLGIMAALQPGHAESDEKAAAVAATQAWLQGIDAGEYAQSWQDASGTFQKAITQEKWVQALRSVRQPLGKMRTRTVASSLHQTDVPSPSGTVKGDFVITQFETSFENLKFAVETVTFEKDNGVWKASGYYVKPKL